MAAHWRLQVTGGDSLDLPETFSLQHHERETEFEEQKIPGQDGVLIDAESRSEAAFDMILAGIISKDDPVAEDTEYMEIEAIADSRENDLNVVNIDTGVSYAVQHVSSRAVRSPAGILRVTLTFRGNVTITNT